MAEKRAQVIAHGKTDFAAFNIDKSMPSVMGSRPSGWPAMRRNPCNIFFIVWDSPGSCRPRSLCTKLIADMNDVTVAGAYFAVYMCTIKSDRRSLCIGSMKGISSSLKKSKKCLQALLYACLDCSDRAAPRSCAHIASTGVPEDVGLVPASGLPVVPVYGSAPSGNVIGNL